VHDRVRPLVVTDRDLGISCAGDGRHGGRERRAQRGQDQALTRYHPFIPMCKWENTWQW
jgi:hypothetical protein